mmetsp:Transcript_46014/g.80897  ORF Transcript_46014/g.80897 Transcript_46014/m.80897 type:complete len:987 (-) Transcript_46014:166-3126(-)
MGAAACKPGWHAQCLTKSMDEGEAKDQPEVGFDSCETAISSGANLNGELTPSTCTPQTEAVQTPSTATSEHSSAESGKLELVTGVPIFKRWLREHLTSLAEAMTEACFRAGETIVQCDEPATDFYIVASGVVAMLRSESPDSWPEKQGTLEKGDFFGEAALTAGKTVGTFVAETNVECFVLSQARFYELGLQKKLHQKRRVIGRADVNVPQLKRLTRGGSEESICSFEVKKTQEDEAFILEALKNNNNLCRLMPSSVNFALDVVRSARKMTVELGEDVIIEGDTVTDHFYVIDDGEFAVLKLNGEEESMGRNSVRARDLAGLPQPETRQVCILSRGASFGEMALLYRAPRSATVRALKKSSLWTIGRTDFKEMLKRVAEENTKEYLSYLDELAILKPLSLSEKEGIAKVLDKVHYSKGDVIFRRGDPASAFYILLDGTVQVEKEGQLRTLNAHLSSRQFQTFGDRTLLEDIARSATVTVVSDSAQCLMLEREDFHMMLGSVRNLFDEHRGTQADMTSRFVRVLDKLEVLNSLTESEKKAVAEALRSADFSKGDVVFKRGDKAEEFYILVDGTLEAFDGANSYAIKATHAEEKVCHFGEKAILENAFRRITVTVKSEKAKALTLDCTSFRLLLSKLRDVFLRFHAVNRVLNRRVEIHKQDLSVEHIITRIPTGLIESCRHNVTNEAFAMKSMNKALIVKSDLCASVFRERDVWLKLDSPFVVKLHTLFNEPQYLHFLCELVPGGGLSDLYNWVGLYGLVGHARFYTAGVIIALKHLHGRRIIHRDIRPENVLLTEFGYPKLVDFSLSKAVIGKTFTTCGTSEYMAPEVLVGTGHTRAVDWWAVGVMVFELLAGHSPFASDCPMDVYSNIMRGFQRVSLPQSCRGTAGDFIHSLLKREPVDRLAMRPGGPDKLCEHAWFNRFSWQSMSSLSLEAPYKPERRKSMREPPISPKLVTRRGSTPQSCEELFYQDDGSGWDEDFAKVDILTY